MDIIKICFTRDNNKKSSTNKLNINIDKVKIIDDKGPQFVRNN